MDWSQIIANSLWLSGLALLLTAISLSDYRKLSDWPPGMGRAAAWRTFSRRAARALSSRWARSGVLLFCLGMALTAGWWLPAALWLLLATWVLYDWRLARRSLGAVQRFSTSVVSSTTNVEIHYTSVGSSNGSAPGSHDDRADGPKRGVWRLAEWAVRAELPVLALLSPFFLFPSPERVLALLAVPALWAARRAARGYFVRRTPLDWAILLMLAMVLVSIFVTPDLAFSLSKITGLVFGIALYYALVEWVTSPLRLRVAVVTYALAGLALALVALLGTSWPAKLPLLEEVVGRLPTLLRGVPGAEGGFNSNEVAAALLWPLPLQFGLVWWCWKSRVAGAAPAAPDRTGLKPAPASRGREWLRRLWPAPVAAISLAGFLLAQSRAALLSLLLALAFLAWVLIPRARMAIAGLLVLSTVAAAYLGPAVLGDGAGSGGGGSYTAALSMQDRVAMWTRGVYGLQDFPITGMGMNMFRRVMPLLYPASGPNFDKDMAHAHNQLLQAGLDLGLPGLVAYLTIWMVAASLVAMTLRSTGSDWLRTVSASIGAGLLASFAFGMVDAIALGARPGFLFWALLAMLVSTWQLSPAQQATAQERMALRGTTTGLLVRQPTG